MSKGAKDIRSSSATNTRPGAVQQKAQGIPRFVVSSLLGSLTVKASGGFLMSHQVGVSGVHQVNTDSNGTSAGSEAT